MTPDKARSSARRPAAAARQARPAALPGLAEQAGQLASDWAPTAGRVLLGLVLAWFGYHELVPPSLWTGYVPLGSTSSARAVPLGPAHRRRPAVTGRAQIAPTGGRAAA